MPVITGSLNSAFVSFSDENSNIGKRIKDAASIVSKYSNTVSSLIQSVVAENSFVEDGVSEIPGTSGFDGGVSSAKQPSRRSMLSQEATPSIFIKKKMFSSLRNGFDPKTLSTEDRLFIRASKNLFRRKCEEIAFYENLTKIEKITESPGHLRVDGFLSQSLDAFFALSSTTFGLVDPSAIFSSNPWLADLYKLKKINERSKPSVFTRWVYDTTTADLYGLGPGAGVIELCVVADFNVRTGVTPDSGSGSLNIQDPYRMMSISEFDIDFAVRQALIENDTSATFNSSSAIFSFEQAMALDRELGESRRRRGKCEINFEYNFKLNMTIGTLVGIDGINTFDDQTIEFLPQDQQLNATERILAIQIISRLNAYYALKNAHAGIAQSFRREFNALRQRMRNEFIGENMIQPMDSVSIFMNSRTSDLSPIYQDGSDIALSDQIIKSFQARSDVISDDLIFAEYENLNITLPYLIYRPLRDASVWRRDGSPIFTGLVKSCSESYSENGFSISVELMNNMQYLKMTRVDVSPSLAQPYKFTYDPLTPFDIDIDGASGLIRGIPSLSDENIKRLPYLRFEDGFYEGKTVKDSKMLFQDINVEKTNSTLFMNHVPGLTYKWKSGIVTETRDVNMSLPLDGDGNSFANFLSTTPQIQTNNPFSNLDAADVISIVVTGQPYNYETFLKNSLDVGTFSIDNVNNSNVYFNHLFDVFERNKPLNGNFVPVKSSIIDPKDIVEAYQIRQQLSSSFTKISRLEQELAKIQDRFKAAAGTNDQKNPDPLESTINAQIIDLKTQIEALQKTTLKDGISVNSIGTNVMVNVPDVDIVAQNIRLREKLKRKPEMVRYNLDQNYFVVSSQYDQDTEIQAFALALKSSSGDLMKSDYKTPYELATMTATTLGFELFCDPSGNIVFRPPEYNKVPISLLLRMISLSERDGVNIAPKFITDLFMERGERIKQQILENELRIHEAVLSLPDSIKTSSLLIPIGNEFALDEKLALTAANETPQNLLTISQREEIRNATGVTPDKITEILKVRNQLNSINGLFHKVIAIDSTEGAAEIQRIQTKEFGGEDVFTAAKKDSIFRQLGVYLSQRQMLLKSYAAQAKNLRYFSDATDSSSGQSAIESQWVQLSVGKISDNLPTVLQDLLENDLANDDGPRSGKRFVINDDVILAASFNHNLPEFNRVTVTGNSNGTGENLGNPNSAIPGLLVAEAVDFDSWRKYGLIENTQDLHRLDFTNAETQCAPYAVFKLLEQRKKIRSGRITVLGNEHYQAGDVVYISYKNMLFYVTEVSHEYSFSEGAYKTTLELSYGRALGEYIPTPLDMIGKGMLSAQRKAYGNISIRKGQKPSSDIALLDTLIDMTYDSGPTLDQLAANGDENIPKIERILSTVARKVNDKNKDSYRIELRAYYVGSEDEIAKNSPVVKKSKEFAAAALRRMKVLFDKQLTKASYPAIESSKISLVQVDLSSKKKYTETDPDRIFKRFPSEKAWSYATAIKDSDGVALPLNCVDVYFVVDKTKSGDKKKS